MTASPKKTKRSSGSSPPTRPKPPSRRNFFDEPLSLVLLLLLDAALFALGFYFLQEGRSQQANPQAHFFVDFPTQLLPLAYFAVLILIPNLAVTFFTILRGLRYRRWPWVTTLIAAICLAVIAIDLGWDGVLTVIDPNR